MRHFFQREALAVLALPDGVDQPPAESILVLSPGAPQALLAGRLGAGPRAVAAPAVAGPAQRELQMAPGTRPDPQLDHEAPTTLAAVDRSAGPCKMEVMGWLDPLLVDPPGSLECHLRAAVFWGAVDYPTMTLGIPGQETGLRATPRSRRSHSRAFRRSLPEDAPNCQRAVMWETTDEAEFGCKTGGTWPVCSKPLGNTEQGLCDMAGNVDEWMPDWYRWSYNGAPTDGSVWNDATDADSKVIRGGTYRSSSGIYPQSSLRTRSRGYWVHLARPPTIGFRCARSLPSEPDAGMDSGFDAGSKGKRVSR